MLPLFYIFRSHKPGGPIGLTITTGLPGPNRHRALPG